MPLPGLADCDQTLPPADAGGSPGRVPETLPCPRLAVQSGRLTWASEPAAWSRPFAGRQVRCRLNRRAAVATSLQSTRDIHPRLPYGRPIKASEVGSFPYSLNCLYGRRTEASRDRSARPKFRDCSRLPWWRSSLACLSSAVQLDRTARGWLKAADYATSSAAPTSPAAYLAPARLHRPAASSPPHTSPGRCRWRRIGSSASSSFPPAPQSCGYAATSIHAPGTAHAIAARGVSSV